MIPAFVFAFVVVIGGQGMIAGPYETLDACNIVHAVAQNDTDVVMLSECIKVVRKLPSA
jgi:hypothetical protein